MTIKSASFLVALAFASAARAFGIAPYAEATAGALLPQGGSRLHGSATAGVRVGAGLGEAWAAEAEGGSAIADGTASLAARALWRFTGYERLDPFLSCGWAAVLGRATGPEFGVGAWYYLSDRWQLRGDARAMPAADDGCRVGFSLALSAGFAF